MLATKGRLRIGLARADHLDALQNMTSKIFEGDVVFEDDAHFWKDGDVVEIELYPSHYRGGVRLWINEEYYGIDDLPPAKIWILLGGDIKKFPIIFQDQGPIA